MRTVSRLDPRSTRNPGLFAQQETADGTVIFGLTVTHPWIWLRRVTPVITGDAFDAALPYTAAAPADLVFDS